MHDYTNDFAVSGGLATSNGTPATPRGLGAPVVAAVQPVVQPVINAAVRVDQFGGQLNAAVWGQGWVAPDTTSLLGVARDTTYGLGTGLKADVNGLSQAGASAISLGYWETQGPLSVTDYDRAMGYNTAVQFSRAGGTILIGVATGQAAGALSQGGTYAQLGSYGIRAWNTAADVTQVGRGIGDASVNGFTWQNSLQIVGGTFGAVGGFSDLAKAAGPRPALDAVEPDVVAPAETQETVTGFRAVSPYRGRSDFGYRTIWSGTFWFRK